MFYSKNKACTFNSTVVARADSAAPIKGGLKKAAVVTAAAAADDKDDVY